VTPDQAAVHKLHPSASTNWTRNQVQIVDAGRVLGWTRMEFRTDYLVLESRAWADAALKLVREGN
jgi:hypothetical protein